MEMLLLTLYKQHYLDQYDREMTTDFSCLGCYDGLTITCIQENNMAFPMSVVWAKTGEQIRKLNGRFSNQNIGLFRCNASGYSWNELPRLPFMALGFVKLKESIRASEIYEKIEGKSKYNAIGSDELCQVLTYYTFDNADIVILVKGNSLILLEEVLRDIEGMEEVTYLHSIWGIDEGYLKECKDGGQILDPWEGTNCHIDKRIEEVRIQLATSGNSTVLERFISAFENWRTWAKENGQGIEGLDEIAYSYIMGHGNVNVTISSSNVRTLLLLLLSQSVLTHQNGVYGYGLYNIETEILIQKQTRKLKEMNVTGCDHVLKYLSQAHKSWCSSTIDKYEKYFDKIPILSEDDALYSYFRALIQTLNTLSQYESFTMSRDIFELIIPSFRLFEELLDKSLSDINNDTWRERIKESLKEYLECVNSVIYHTIHTDQVYLMIPGYSGTSFSIPIKLSMFYSWFIERVGNILNDADRKYGCIIKPVMESRPITRVININPQEKDMLVCVQLAQHSLYKPGELFIILAHEIAHYINRNSRMREYRSNCIARTLAYYIAEGICNIHISDNSVVFGDGIAEELVRRIRKKLLNEIYFHIWGRIQAEFSEGAHSKELEPALKRMCRELISEEDRGNCICQIIRKIPAEVIGMIDNGEDWSVGQMQLIYKIQREMENKRCEFLFSQIMEGVINDLIVVYKEVFSDIAAHEILGGTEEQFIEAFTVSEGARKGGDECMKSREHRIRVKVLRNVVFSGKSYEETTMKKEVLKNDPSGEMYGDLYHYKWVQTWLINYAKRVQENLAEYLSQQGKSDEVKEIRKTFQILSDKESGLEKVYLGIEDKIKDYKENVTKELRGYCGN